MERQMGSREPHKKTIITGVVPASSDAVAIYNSMIDASESECESSNQAIGAWRDHMCSVTDSELLLGICNIISGHEDIVKAHTKLQHKLLSKITEEAEKDGV